MLGVPTSNQIRDDPVMMELFIKSQNENRANSPRRNSKGWFRKNRFMLLFIVFWLSIIAIAVAL
jgi:hypothetical protein